MKGLIIFIVVCTLTSAMVPMDREAPETTNSSTTTVKLIICAPKTPCAWSVYRPETREIEIHIESSYCLCNNETECVRDEDDTTANAFIYKCRPKNATVS